MPTMSKRLGVGWQRGQNYDARASAARVLRPSSIVTARGMERTRLSPWGLQGGRASGLTSTAVNEGAADERDSAGSTCCTCGRTTR